MRPAMKIDMHVHLADVEALQAAGQAGRGARPGGHLARMLRRAFVERPDLQAGEGANRCLVQYLADQVKESPLDKVVLLALDAVFDASGRACPDRTRLQVDNDFVCHAAAQHPEFLFGASIHPYRPDAVSELERLVKQGACLVKWIPSGQWIEPDDPACFPFYDALAHYGIPLLSHTGIEHTLGCGRASFNHPRRLVPALERGVTVIAAHCGVHLFLHEWSHFGAWASLAREHANLYGDSGAFAVVTRVPYLKRILRDPILKGKLLYGSDFPGIPSPRWCWQLGPGRMGELSRVPNPLARNMRVMQALGMPAAVFNRAHEIGIGSEEIAA